MPRPPDPQCAEGCVDVPVDAHHLTAPVRVRDPRFDQLSDGELDVVVEHLGARRRVDLAPVIGQIGRRELGAVVGIRGERVLGFPRLQGGRDVEHRCEIDVVDRFAADRPFVGDE